MDEEEGVCGEGGGWRAVRAAHRDVKHLQQLRRVARERQLRIDWPSSSTIRCFTEEFQWFLIELSVRPGRRRAISAHRLPGRSRVGKGI